MDERIFVTGIGIISSIGNDSDQNYNSLITTRSGIGLANYLQGEHIPGFLFGEVKLSNKELANGHALRTDHFNSRTALLGLRAAKEAIKNADLQSTELKNAGLVNGTSVGGMDVSEGFYKGFLNGEKIDFRKSFYAHDCGFSTEYIADSLGLKGYISTVSTACSSSANSIAFASQLIKTGKLKIAIAGGADALTKFTFSGFNSLMIVDPDRCKPFDEERKGLNLGEGAAFVVLEVESSMLARKSKPMAELVGHGNASDAYHQTASSPEGTGATLAMQKALTSANLKPSDISYVNAHGTGTQNNDLSECVALKNVFGDRPPHYSSTKSYTGHTLGAAGAIEAVFSILAIQKNFVIANQPVSKPMDILKNPPVRECLKDMEIKHVLSNSFGFGGNCTSLIFARA
jgi:3-oxoacyl-[acyl-carrier-protein] synthase-1